MSDPAFQPARSNATDSAALCCERARLGQARAGGALPSSGRSQGEAERQATEAEASSQPTLLRFAIRAWSAWAPGLTEAETWRRWAADPWLPRGDDRPELAELPMLLRRRMDRLARMALHTTARVQAEQPCPMIFASRRGETLRALQMLQELADSGQVAPGPFSLSVHNAVAGLQSISTGNTGNFIALAAGQECAEAAVIEALGLLAEGHREVSVTVYDEILPDCYRSYADEPDTAFAWSWRLARADDDATHGLEWSAHSRLASCNASHDPGSRWPELPAALRVLAFQLSESSRWHHDGPSCRWTWHQLARSP